MSEMIERVAKELHERLSGQDIHGYLGANFDLHEVARAAIEAMKPTTNRMDVAGCLYLRENHSDASGCFETMIDAALKD